MVDGVGRIPASSQTWILANLRILLTLAHYEIKIRYTNSNLGIIWMAIEPLIMVTTFTLLFILLERGNHLGVPYPIFFYVGLLPFNLFRKSLTAGSSVFRKKRSLLKKTELPRELLVLSTWIAFLVETVIASLLFMALVFIYQIPISITWIAVFPLVLLLCVTSICVMLIVSLLDTYVHDVGLVMPMFCNVLFWMTPIIFNFPFEGGFRYLYFINPLVGPIQNLREVILFNQWPTWSYSLPSTIITIGLIYASLRVFKRLNRGLADEF